MYNLLSHAAVSCIDRTGEYSFTTFNIHTYDLNYKRTADGLDYTGGLMTAKFSGTSTASVQVLTLSDNVLEGDETFTGVILVPRDTIRDYRVTPGLPDNATIQIIDDDSKFILLFPVNANFNIIAMVLFCISIYFLTLIYKCILF